MHIMVDLGKKETFKNEMQNIVFCFEQKYLSDLVTPGNLVRGSR